MNTYWIIQHKETKEVWKAKSGKTSWNKQGHAKSAWANNYEYLLYDAGWKSEVNLFKNQTEYEVVEVKSDVLVSYEILLCAVEAIAKWDGGPLDRSKALSFEAAQEIAKKALETVS